MRWKTVKLSRSLENRGILLKGTTWENTSQEGGFLNFLRPLMTASWPLMKNAHIPLAKYVLLPVGVTAATSGSDAAIKKKMFRSGMATLIFSNEELGDIMKIVKSLEDSGLLIKGVSETVENALKE